MLNKVSWNAYFEFVVLVLIIYYSIILYLFYTTDIKNWLSLKFQGRAPDENNIEKAENKTVPDNSEPIDNLLDEVKALIGKAGNNRSPKEEILFAIQKILSSEQFRFIDKQYYKYRIDNLISKELQGACSIHVSEEDLRVLWA